jgi:aminoglycoside 6'-N-acetyltransferase I
MNNITIRPASQNDLQEWLRMRLALWPHHNDKEMLAEMEVMLATPQETPVLIAFSQDGSPCGFLEGGLRKYADGCQSSPVGYIEGWYVDEAFREQGVGGAMVKTFEDWCWKMGLAEIGSDTWEDNLTSINAHKKLGYTEVERLVHFVKKLA